MKINLYILPIFLAFISCNNQNNTEPNPLTLEDMVLWDTLTLTGSFADCGEWGGHHETFNIFRLNQKNEIGFIYERDTVKCYNPQLFDRRIVERLNGTVSKNQWTVIERYLSTVLKKSFDNEGLSNAANAYTIQQNGIDYWIDSIPILNIRYVNYRMDWNGFEILKTKLLQTENEN